MSYSHNLFWFRVQSSHTVHFLLSPLLLILPLTRAHSSLPHNAHPSLARASPRIHARATSINVVELSRSHRAPAAGEKKIFFPLEGVPSTLEQTPSKKPLEASSSESSPNRSTLRPVRLYRIKAGETPRAWAGGRACGLTEASRGLRAAAAAPGADGGVAFLACRAGGPANTVAKASLETQRQRCVSKFVFAVAHGLDGVIFFEHSRHGGASRLAS